MAKGKQSLLETTDPKNIIDTNEEVGSIPFFDIDDEYGISGGYGDMALVLKKRASKTGKEENGEDKNKVYAYWRWEEQKYSSDLYDIFDIYFKTKRLNAFKGQRTKDIKDLIKIEQELSEHLHNILDININLKFREACNLTDTILQLKEQIKEASNSLSKYTQLINEAEHKFKEARKIIVDNMPKKDKKHNSSVEE